MNKPKNIEELFNRLNKQTPFKVPKGYFEELEDKVMNKVENDKEKDLQLPFEVPQGYFDGLADKVLAKVEEKPTKKLTWINPMAYAASVAVLLMLSIGIYYMRLPQKTETAVITFDEVPTDELYLAMQEDVSIDLIAEVIEIEEEETTESPNSTIKDDSIKVKSKEKEVEDKLDVVPTDELEEFLLEDIDDIFIDEI